MCVCVPPLLQAEWDAKRCDLRVEELREKVRELQLMHVTRDMQVRAERGWGKVRSKSRHMRPGSYHIVVWPQGNELNHFNTVLL